jgi:hypothetical protein
MMLSLLLKLIIQYYSKLCHKLYRSDEVTNKQQILVIQSLIK